MFKTRIFVSLLAWWSHILLVLSRESLRLFPNARHLDNASDLQRVYHKDRNVRDLLILFSIDQRFDFDFVRDIARSCPERKIVIYGGVAHNDEAIRKTLAELCAQQSNVVYAGRYEFDGVPAILAPYAIGVAPYTLDSTLTEFINPDKYYMFLQAGLEVISTNIPQARRMAKWIHVVNSGEEVARSHNASKGKRGFEGISASARITGGTGGRVILSIS